MRALAILLFLAPRSMAAISSTSETIQRVSVVNASFTVTGVIGTVNVTGSTVNLATGTTVSLASGTIVQIATGTNNIGTVTGSTVTIATGNQNIGTVSGSTVIISAILGTVTVTPSTAVFSVNALHNYRSDFYSAPGNGFILNVSSSPLRTFAISVTGIGGSATTWDARLEGSLDGVNFTQLLKHTELEGDGQPLYSGTTLAPSLFIRSRVVALVLGAASAINVIILGVQ